MELSELPDPEGLLPLVPSDDVDFRAFLEHCLSDRQDGCSLGGGLQVKEGHQPQSQQQQRHLQQPVRQLSCSLDAQACSQIAGQQPAAPAAAACKIIHLAHCSQWGMGEAVHWSVSLPGGIPATAAWYCSHPQQLLPQFSLPAAGKLACNTQQGLMASSSNGMHAPPAHRGAAAAAHCAGIPPVPVAVPLTAPFRIAAPAATVSLRAPAAMPAACPSGLAPAASSLFAPRALAAAAAPLALPATAVSLGGGMQAAPLAMHVGSAPDLRAVQATRTIAKALCASTLGPNKQPFKKSRKPDKMDDLEFKVSQAQDTNQKLKEQLQELQQDKRTLATQLSTMQLELSMLQDSNRHLKENICHSRDAVAALMQQLQSRCLVADGSSRQQLLGTVPPQVMHMSRLGCSGPAGHAHDRSGLGCH